ncbi:MAG: DsbA family protein [Alphaproteobacteria bacterium]
MFLMTSLPKKAVRNFLRTVYFFLALTTFYTYSATADEQQPTNTATINMDNASFAKGYESVKDLVNAADFDQNKIRILGSADAPLTLWDISSYGCPHCANFHKNALPEIYSKYIETGKLRLAFLNTAMDELSVYITATTYATTNMEQFLAYSNMIYADQNKWYSNNYQAEITRMLAANGISTEQLNKTLESKELNTNLPLLLQYISEVLKVHGTPHFILSKTGDSPEQSLGFVEGNDKEAVIKLIEKGLVAVK